MNNEASNNVDQANALQDSTEQWIIPTYVNMSMGFMKHPEIGISYYNRP